MKKFIGTGVALVTPFNKDGSVDTHALTNIVTHVIEGGIEYLVVLGTTAESAVLTSDEKKLVVDTIVKANNNRLPIVLGIGGNNTAAVVAELKTTDLQHIDAVLSVSPFYNKPTQEGIYQHFKAISEASPKPIILYNVPGRTASNMLPETIIRLANDFENIIAVKEAAGDIVQAMRLLKDAPKDFLVISGDDMITMPMVFAGGAGVISVIGQGYPTQFSEMVRLGLAGKIKEANEILYTLMPAIDYIFEEGNPAGIKAIFEKLKLSTATVRLPLVEASDALKQKLNHFTDRLNS
ncbi:4-hydroxy-tetrahydrodipicolinate synthase [Kordia sp. YSTF-M3]|uniref:4-hydroxy-tetrahydrodipicolinate synthase n=1 Tax=Kordia aestuariivivens TaxID=2759037 RepID=A0ABR7QC77_9FLAO|nr:4-hydroxy-tetrahydrodipicolinate synthase [Kordia aestuariivivens]MBC8756166.1 4-hydroxy-tetrahydrodipicolinate synthase [Kordia aestuariivivens]